MFSAAEEVPYQAGVAAQEPEDRGHRKALSWQLFRTPYEAVGNNDSLF
jgi:hypothetical protein